MRVGVGKVVVSENVILGDAGSLGQGKDLARGEVGPLVEEVKFLGLIGAVGGRFMVVAESSLDPRADVFTDEGHGRWRCVLMPSPVGACFGTHGSARGGAA